MRIVALLLLLVCASASPGSCPPDLSGTVPTVENKGLPSFDICFYCRELNRFPQDYSNDAWNYIRHGDAAFTYAYYYGQTGTIGSSTSQMTIRACGPLGQCANTTIVTIFNMVIVPVYGISTPVRKSIQAWRVITRLPSGKTQVSEYMKSAETNEPRPVPSTPGDDGFDRDDCLNNDGTKRGASGSDSGGGGISPTAPRCYRDRGDRYVCD